MTWLAALNLLLIDIVLILFVWGQRDINARTKRTVSAIVAWIKKIEASVNDAYSELSQIRQQARPR